MDSKDIKGLIGWAIITALFLLATLLLALITHPYLIVAWFSLAMILGAIWFMIGFAWLLYVIEDKDMRIGYRFYNWIRGKNGRS